MANPSSEAINVRFLINGKTQRIVYAESGKEFVDFLFSLLSMPLGSVLNLLKFQSNRKIGSISNLYSSVEKLPSELMSREKSELLEPRFITSYYNKSLRIGGGSLNYYVCPFATFPGTHNISTNPQDLCMCGNLMNRLLQLRLNGDAGTTMEDPSEAATYGSLRFGKPQSLAKAFFVNANNALQRKGSSGYVKEMITFIITDDLKIKRSSTITTITLLNELNVKDLTDLQERNAIVDRSKAVEILEASLVSTTVLNDVFGPAFAASGKGCHLTNFGETDSASYFVMCSVFVHIES